MFNIILIKKLWKYRLSSGWSSWRKSVKVATERVANASLETIINPSSHLESISAYKSLDTKESSSVIKNLTFDNSLDFTFIRSFH